MMGRSVKRVRMMALLTKLHQLEMQCRWLHAAEWMELDEPDEWENRRAIADMAKLTGQMRKLTIDDQMCLWQRIGETLPATLDSLQSVWRHAAAHHIRTNDAKH